MLWQTLISSFHSFKEFTEMGKCVILYLDSVTLEPIKYVFISQVRLGAVFTGFRKYSLLQTLI